jgi:predicted phage baseplate assembly protein
MKKPRCGCCEGIERLTPLPTANRPGLEALRYRVGTHATFLETMLARLSTHRLDDGRRPLQRLTTRAKDDPSIALLDAWATVGDVLTFYQERIVNEGYLLTATERRSVLELARLVGYELRPGVAASVYLAFTLDKNFDIEIPGGTRARSLPGPGELPQAFETDEAIRARTVWNALTPRLTRPSVLQPDAAFEGVRSLYLQGAATDLDINDVVLFVREPARQPYTVRTVEADATASRTRVEYTPYGTGIPSPAPPGGAVPPGGGAPTGGPEGNAPKPALTRLASVVAALRKDPSLPPASRFQLARSPERTYGASADLAPQLLSHFYPRLKDTLYTAYANAPVTGVSPEDLSHVEAMRAKAAPFGHNAPLELVFNSDNVLVGRQEWSLAEFDSEFPTDEQFRTLSLDGVYDEIAVGSYVVIDRADHTEDNPIVAQVQQVRTISRAAYGISARVTQLVLSRPWLSEQDSSLSVVRGTTVYAQSETLAVAEEPIEDAVAGETIELDALYDGLDPGRWLLVRGERTDVLDAEGNPVEGVEASELVMLAGIEQKVGTAPDADGNEIEIPTDTLHTRLILSEPLAYAYKRDTVTINANVARATHGETQVEVLGNGDAAKAFQQFALRQSPLTFVAAATPEGVASTLEVRINEVRWPEHETLLFVGGNERGYETKTDDDGITSVTFGDGVHGPRLPSGSENVTAVYRSGIGKGGNVVAGKISSLATRPLGVKEVINPQRASGGADPENRDQARRNVPLATLALDRLVSVQDYADFTRTFAGIGKAYSASLSDGRREVVHLTIAGAEDAPIDALSDLYRNLLLALARFGDPNTPLQVALREAVFLFISARVKVLEDYLWANVEPKIRAALLDTFSFERRELGQDVLLSEVIQKIQGIAGVDYVDVDLLEGVSESDAADPEILADKLEALAAAAGGGSQSAASACKSAGQPKQRLVVELARVDPTIADPAMRIRPAQIAYLNPDLADTLILTEVTS